MGPRIDTWREALDHLDIVLAQDATERETHLASLQHSRPAVYAALRKLLQAERAIRATGFLEPLPDRDAEPPLQAGARLGPHRIERQLGAGGTGTVWLARRDDGLYEEAVAIKLLHRHLSSSAVRDRFLREASLLGRLQHPNIARILDAGVHEGSAYLVLEHIDGEPLDAWCDARQLTTARRLQLFIEVCEAVAHAHSHLIVHRDIKPSNVLVTGDGKVKLLDFGIGKQVHDQSTGAAATELTQVTGRVLTPDYAAPEQILDEAITTATDVYSLGVLLYVLLSGVRPFASAGPASARIEQAVLNDEPASLDRAARDAPEACAANRGSSPSKLQRDLAGDLANIVACAMRKRPQDRYRSVLALAEDVRRHLAHEPVLARKPSPLYRASRFIRRHRVSVAASAIAAAAVAMAATSVGLQARAVKREANKAAAVREFLLDVFNANSLRHPDGARARQSTAEELLATASEKMLAMHTGDPELQAELVGTLAGLNRNLEKFEEAEALLRQQLSILDKAFGANDLRTAKPAVELAAMIVDLERYDEAIQLLTKARALLEEHGESTSLLAGRIESLSGYVEYTRAWDEAGTQKAIRHYDQAVRILERLPASDELVTALYGLSASVHYADRVQDALHFAERGMKVALTLHGPDDIDVGEGHQQLGGILTRMRRFEEAETHLAKALEITTRAYGPEHSITASVYVDLARLKENQGQYRAAVANYTRFLEIEQRLFGESVWARNVRVDLGIALAALGNFAAAGEAFDTNIQQLQDGSNDQLLAQTHLARARLRLEQQSPEDALADADRGLERIDAEPVSRRTRARLHATRAEALAALRRLDEAEAAMHAAESMIENESESGFLTQLTVRLARVRVSIEQGSAAEAQQRATDLLQEVRARKDRRTLWEYEDAALRHLARAQRMSGTGPEFCATLGEAIALREAHGQAGDPRLLQTRKLRAQCPKKA
jgi:serine/threonine-protein kinase